MRNIADKNDWIWIKNRLTTIIPDRKLIFQNCHGGVDFRWRGISPENFKEIEQAISENSPAQNVEGEKREKNKHDFVASNKWVFCSIFE